MRFETQKDIDRETKAIEKLIQHKSKYNLTYKKLGHNDIDFVILKDDNKVAVVEVKGRNKYIEDAFPLPVALRKVAKLQDQSDSKYLFGKNGNFKIVSPSRIILWDCLDGIIYAPIIDIKGEVRYGGRVKRFGSANDQEIMIYYPNQKNFTIIKDKE